MKQIMFTILMAFLVFIPEAHSTTNHKQLVSHIVTASSFADPKDVIAYKKAIAQGKTEAEALKVGDNGIGLWGDNTARDDIPMCALPSEEWLEKWKSKENAHGKKVAVTYKGKTVIGELQDTMPAKAKITNGAGIDLNLGFAKEFNVSPPFMLPNVEWKWAE
jgi:hypothetical protein